jgi:hypothetical protein
VTAGAFDTTHNGSHDVVVTKLDSALSALTYSTFVGGPGIDGDFGVAIAVDAAGNAYVGGNTTGSFPTANAFQGTIAGGDDAFALKLNGSGTQLRMSTFLGGSAQDWVNDIAVDGAGNVYATGVASDAATPLPTSPTAFQAEHGGSIDAFVAKFGDFSIGGRIVDEDGAPVAGALLTLSGPLDGTVTTDGQGWYAFLDTLVNESFLVAPGDDRANPRNYTVGSLTSNHRVNFVVDFQAPFGDPGTSDGQRP